MSPTPPDCWVPLMLQWQHVLPGDVFVGGDGQLWHVVETKRPIAALWITAQKGAEVFTTGVDWAESIPVLVSVPERDADTVCREVLGAQISERRINAPQ